MTKHTPTPELFVEHLKAVGNIPEEWSVESECRCYARCVNQDDAEMFVRAVNAYEKDQEIKKEILDLIKTQIESMNRAGEHLNYSGMEWKHKAEQAIDKAES